MATTKPTILLISGAWFHSSTYDSFISHLQQLSFPTVYASYPSLNPSDPKTACASLDTGFIINEYLHPLIEDQGKDVVIVMHCYGGVPGSAAAVGLGKVQRVKKEKKGGVVGLIYISAIVVPGGASAADGLGGLLPLWVKQHQPYYGLTMPEYPLARLYADIDPVIAKENALKLVPHAILALKSTSPDPAWRLPAFEGRLAYLACTDDAAIPRYAQEGMMRRSEVKWVVKEMDGSHTSPFLKWPGQTAKAVDAFVAGF